MNLDAYRVFYEVAARGSVTKAAQNLFVTQSAVSQAIAQMERELGVTLFMRKPRGVVLTAEGEGLFGHVGQAMESLRRGEQQLQKLMRLEEGLLSVAASDTMSEKLLLPYLERYHGLYPHIRLKVVNKTSGDTLRLLMEGEAELGFVNMPLAHKDIIFRPCLQVHDVFVASPALADSFGTRVSWETVASGRLIMLEDLSNSRRFVDACFREKGLTLKPDTELGAHGLLLEFARAGLGVSCVIREFARDHLETGILKEIPLAEDLPAREIAMCHVNAPLSTAAREFIKLLEPLFLQAAGGQS